MSLLGSSSSPSRLIDCGVGSPFANEHTHLVWRNMKHETGITWCVEILFLFPECYNSEEKMQSDIPDKFSRTVLIFDICMSCHFQCRKRNDFDRDFLTINNFRQRCFIMIFVIFENLCLNWGTKLVIKNPCI